MEKRDALYSSVRRTSMLASYGGAWGKKEIFPSEWYGEGVYLTFEGIQVLAPSQYHNLLTHMYGDYMQPPPEDKRVAHHYVDVFDLNKSYKEYMGNNIKKLTIFDIDLQASSKQEKR